MTVLSDGHKTHRLRDFVESIVPRACLGCSVPIRPARFNRAARRDNTPYASGVGRVPPKMLNLVTVSCRQLQLATPGNDEYRGFHGNEFRAADT